MLQKFLLAAALVGVALPALAQQQGTPQERAACAPAVRKFCKSQMRTLCGCWRACRPIARRSAQLATRSCSATASKPAVGVPKQLIGGEEALAGLAQGLNAIQQANVWRDSHAQDVSERLTESPVGCVNLAGARPPPLDCQGFKAPLSPRRGFPFWS
jgi:hypothetical protein